MKKIIYILTVGIFLTIIEGIFVCDLYARIGGNVAPPTVYTEGHREFFPPGVPLGRMTEWNIRKKRVERENAFLRAQRRINSQVEHNPLMADERKRRNMDDTERIVESAARVAKGASSRTESTNPDGTRSIQYTGTHLSGLLIKLDEYGLDVEIGGRTLREKILEAYGGDNTKYVWSLNINNRSLDKLGNFTEVNSVALRDRKGLARVRFTRAKEQVYSENRETGEYGTTEVITKRWEDNIEYVSGSKGHAVNFTAPLGRKDTNAFNLIESSHQIAWDSREPDKIIEIITEWKYDIGARLAIEEHRTFMDRYTAPDGTEIEHRWEETIEIDPDDYKRIYTADLEGVNHLRTHFQRKIFGSNRAIDLIIKNKIWQEFDENDRLEGSFTFSRETGANGLDRSSIYIKNNIKYDLETGMALIGHDYINIPHIEPDQVQDLYGDWRNGGLAGSIIGTSGIAILDDDELKTVGASSVLSGNDNTSAKEVAGDIVETAGEVEAAKSDAKSLAENWVGGRELDLNNPEDRRILNAWKELSTKMTPGAVKF